MIRLKNHNFFYLSKVVIVMIFVYVLLFDPISVEAKSFDQYISIKQNNGKIIINFLNGLDDLEPDFFNVSVSVSIYDSNRNELYYENLEYKKIDGKKLMITGLESGTYIIEFDINGHYFRKKVKIKSTINKDCKDIKIGDKLYFGSFEQDGNLNNGSEKIEWIVMSIEDNKALLYSSYVLYLKCYNYPGACTWETSELRKWLNGEFYDTAFEKNEKKCIKKKLIHNDNISGNTNIDGGIATNDKVFLPEWPKKIDSDITDVLCCFDPGIATKYVKKEWSYADSYEGYYGFWLLGIGSESNMKAKNMNYLPLHIYETVDNITSNYSFGINDGDKADLNYATGGVRPAIYVDINKLKEIKKTQNYED